MRLAILLLAGISCLSLQAQDKNGVPFNGQISDLLGAPVNKVKVYTKSPKTYTTTDKKGRFGLTDVKADDTLHLVYKKTVYAIPVQGRKSAKIKLGDQLESTTVSEDEQLFNLGYGYVKHREYLNAGNRLTGEELSKGGYTTVMQALQGRVPGLNISTDSFGRTVNSSIRGVNSNGAYPPLLLLDDAEVNSFDGINLNDVDYVEVQKDANIYGIKGANGVIKVYTKSARKSK